MFFFLKKAIEWTEGEVSRGRKIVLFTTIFVYLLTILLTLIIFVINPSIVNDEYVDVFAIFTGLMVTVYAFYTGTTARITNFFTRRNKRTESFDINQNTTGFDDYNNDPYLSDTVSRHTNQSSPYTDEYNIQNVSNKVNIEK